MCIICQRVLCEACLVSFNIMSIWIFQYYSRLGELLIEVELLLRVLGSRERACISICVIHICLILSPPALPPPSLSPSLSSSLPSSLPPSTSLLPHLSFSKQVIKKKAWRAVAKELHLPASITSAAFTMRSQWVTIFSLSLILPPRGYVIELRLVGTTFL